MPPLYMAGFSALGNPEGWNPLYRNDQSYTANANASWTKGAHDIRFGFDFVHHLMNHWQPELGEGPRGAFYFDPGVTALNPEALEAAGGFLGDTPSFENDWNSALRRFLLGTPDVVGEEQPVHQDEQLREPVRALHPRSLARHAVADARPGTAMGALPEPEAIRRPGHRVRTIRPPTKR